ncbi:MAG TPA: hypothetical protein VMF87_05860 [Streptosporangiaceae bacterium]|nr:hypothetical protein [Streptosporangiaceae bacterium]
MTYAREFLAGTRRRKVAELPPTVLARELAEARRVLGQLLDLVTDFEDANVGEDVTRVTMWAGYFIAPADVPAFDAALADAITYREPAAECAASGDEGLYPTHEADLERANAYRALARALDVEESR